MTDDPNADLEWGAIIFLICLAVAQATLVLVFLGVI